MHKIFKNKAQGTVTPLITFFLFVKKQRYLSTYLSTRNAKFDNIPRTVLDISHSSKPFIIQNVSLQ